MNEGGSSILGGLLGGLFSKNQSVNPHENRQAGQLRPTAPMNPQQSQVQQQQQPFHPQQQSNNMQPVGTQSRFIPIPGARAQLNSQSPHSQLLQQQQQHQKKARYFIAMFDYDPSTMSPNPDGCEEELPFREGDTIRVYGDKDGDGFYWGELRGRRGYVPHNMVTEVDEIQNFTGSTTTTAPVVTQNVTTTQSMRNISRDRWGDIYANTPVKRMIALYDYDPQELSPNVDAEQVELCFKTGEVILVYGDMDEDGFYMGELDGVRGLVPSNFLADAPDQFNNQVISGSQSAPQRSVNNRTKGQGPGARGPPPPPRENILSGITNQRCALKKDARPASPTLLDNTGQLAPDHPTQVTQEIGGMIVGGNNVPQYQNSIQQQEYDIQQQQEHQLPPVSQQSGGGLFLGATNLISGATQAATGGLFGSKFKTDQNAAQQMHQQPQGLGKLFGGGHQQQMPVTNEQANQQQTGQGPGFMSKLNEMAAPGSDILSKAKDSFFGKFGFGK